MSKLHFKLYKVPLLLIGSDNHKIDIFVRLHSENDNSNKVNFLRHLTSNFNYSSFLIPYTMLYFNLLNSNSIDSFVSDR